QNLLGLARNPSGLERLPRCRNTVRGLAVNRYMAKAALTAGNLEGSDPSAHVNVEVHPQRCTVWPRFRASYRTARRRAKIRRSENPRTAMSPKSATQTIPIEAPAEDPFYIAATESASRPR